MQANIQLISNEGNQCARERKRLRNHYTLIKSYPANYPLVYVDIDILDLFTESKRSHKFILVITDRVLKINSLFYFRFILAVTVLKVFVPD